MKTVNINIQLDPIEDGVDWEQNEETKTVNYGSLIIGTNGECRFAEEAEVMNILDRLGDHAEFDRIPNTHFMIVYNKNKVIHFGDSKYFVGSAMILKEDGVGLVFITEEEAEVARNKFIGRFITLVSNGVKFSGYEVN